MSADSFQVIEAGHFDGQSNLTEGQRTNGLGLSQWIRKFKAGRHTFSGSGSEAVAFGEAFDDANYSIAFGKSTTAVNPIYASKAADGFTITAAAAGIVDWIAIHD